MITTRWVVVVALVLCGVFPDSGWGNNGIRHAIVVEATTDFTNLRVVQLRRELRLRGLKRTGSREELVARLQASDSNGITAAAPTITKKEPPPLTGPCHPNPCGQFGLCSALKETAQFPYQCACAQEWYGVHCNQSRTVASEIKVVRQRAQAELELEAARQYAEELRVDAEATASVCNAARKNLEWQKFPVLFKKGIKKNMQQGHTLRYTDVEEGETEDAEPDDDERRRRRLLMVTAADGQEVARAQLSTIARISPAVSRARAKNLKRGQEQVSIWTRSAKRNRQPFRHTKQPHAFDVVFQRGRSDLNAWLELMETVLDCDSRETAAALVLSLIHI